VLVTNNAFKFDPGHLGPACLEADDDPSSRTPCGYNALFASYGTLIPYKGWAVADDISNTQNNHFAGNTYSGPWRFVAFTQGNTLTWAKWRIGTSENDGSGLPFAGQDARTTYREG
jgi:hypothetical protein